MDSKTLKNWQVHWQDEVDAAFLYRVLVECERATERRTIYVRLAVIDEVMPRMGGRAALARMRRSVPGLPAILCTGYTWSLDGKTQEGGDTLDILPKPWRPRELLRIVRETLEARKARLPGAGDNP